MLRRSGARSRRDRSHPGRKRHGQLVAAVAESTLVAKQAGLRYVSSSAPGILRAKRGKGFIYRLPSGKRLRNASELERIRKLALPPAWRNVWICVDPRGHLLATGVDARGRKQYRYHPHWRTVRDEAKYGDLVTFARKLPQLRRALERDLAAPGLHRDKVLATVVAVMERTAVRVGNDRYTNDNGSYGLTTLLDRHARISGGTVEFAFKGKGGKPYRARIADRRLASIVKRCRDIPGQRLFQYLAPDGSFQAVSSSDVNGYLKRVTGISATAKTFRTWTATLLAARELSALAPADSEAGIKRQVNVMLAVVANELGNTPAICRKSYVDPRVIDAFAGERIARACARAARTAGLSAAECRLLAILESVAQPERRAA